MVSDERREVESPFLPGLVLPHCAAEQFSLEICSQAEVAPGRKTAPGCPSRSAGSQTARGEALPENHRSLTPGTSQQGHPEGHQLRGEKGTLRFEIFLFF